MIITALLIAALSLVLALERFYPAKEPNKFSAGLYAASSLIWLILALIEAVKYFSA